MRNPPVPPNRGTEIVSIARSEVILHAALELARYKRVQTITAKTNVLAFAKKAVSKVKEAFSPSAELAYAA